MDPNPTIDLSRVTSDQDAWSCATRLHSAMSDREKEEFLQKSRGFSSAPAYKKSSTPFSKWGWCRWGWRSSPLFLFASLCFSSLFFLRFSLILLGQGKTTAIYWKLGNFTPTPSTPTPFRTSRRKWSPPPPPFLLCIYGLPQPPQCHVCKFPGKEVTLHKSAVAVKI